MPAGDVTHPVPDTAGYITEGQLVFSPELHAQGLYPPFDALGSLSRLMRLGAGPGRRVPDRAARVLLLTIDRHPEAVADALVA